MSEGVIALQELVLRRLEELGEPGRPLSYKAVELASRGRVSHETVRQIAVGIHSGRLTDRTAEGLAAGLRLPVDQIYKAAKVRRPGSRWRWPEEFDRLTEPERRVVESVAAGFLRAYERGQRDA